MFGFIGVENLRGILRIKLEGIDDVLFHPDDKAIAVT